MEANYKKLSLSLGILLAITLALVLMMSNKKVVSTASYDELTRQTKSLIDRNSKLSKSIDSLKLFNSKIDSIILKLESQKTIIKYEFIEKSKEIDNGSVSYLVDEYKIIFTKNNIR